VGIRAKRAARTRSYGNISELRGEYGNIARACKERKRKNSPDLGLSDDILRSVLL
jgi:hypothetical protein